MRITTLCFAATAVFAASVACKTVAPGTTVKDAAETSESPSISRPCIISSPIEADGYHTFEPVSDAKVKRLIMSPNGPIPDPVKTVTPTVTQVNATMANISAFIDTMNQVAPPGTSDRRQESYSPRGDAIEPYCLFHTPGQAIYGTVLLFHGFNDRPLQQAKLASYLFHAGFNIYNVYLVNHWLVPGTKHWPKVVYRPDVLALIAQKLALPENQAAINALKPELAAGQITPQAEAQLDGILKPQLSVADLKAAWSDPTGPDFAKFYESQDGVVDNSPGAVAPDFLSFVTDAQSRLADLAPLNGPVFLSGLSVGGALVLALAEADGGRHVHGVVAEAPWLQSINASQQSRAMIGGPLDDKITLIGGDYPLSFANHKIKFSPATVTANEALGAYVATPSRVRVLATVPTEFVTTAVDDSADPAATAALNTAIATGPVAVLHQHVEYPAALNVGHAMTDPENYVGEDVAVGEHWNMYWRTLYQETLRFFLTGKMLDDRQHLFSKAQESDMPLVACVMADPVQFGKRCNM